MMRSRGIVFTIVSAMLFGITPAFAKLIYADGINSSTLVFYRNLFAILPLFLLCLSQHCSFRINLRQGFHLVLTALIGQAVTAVMLYSSYNYIPIATATTLHFFYPIFITLICVILFHDRLSMPKLIALISATCGVSCFVEGRGSESLRGISLALASALTFAYYMVAVEKSGLNRLHPFVITFYFSIVVSVSLFLYNAFFHQFPDSVSALTYGKMALFAFFTSVAAMALLQLGIRFLGAGDAAILCMFEPLTSVVSGIFLLKEEISLLKLIGCILSLGAVTFMIVMNQRAGRKKEDRIRSGCGE